MKNVLLIILTCTTAALNAQSWQWARQPAGTNSNQEVLGTTVSNTGDVFICGYYQTSLNIGTATTLTVNFPGDYQNYVGKYNAAGQAQWLRNVIPVSADATASLDISSDTLGNCYVICGYGYAFATPGSIFNYASLYGGFHELKKINSTGQDVWTQSPSFASNSACTMESVKSDKSGNTYVTGFISGSVTFGSVTLSSPGVACPFVVKYEPTGAVAYAVKATNNGEAIAHSIDVDENGYAVIAGEFQNGITFGTTNLASNGLRDGFMARLDPNGNFIWAHSEGSLLNDAWYGVAIDNPRIYITGNFNENFTFGPLNVTTHGGQDVLVACTDTAANVLWATANGGGGNDDIGYDIAADHLGGIYVSGNYNGPATFGPVNLTGQNGAYLVKYDIIGIQQWVKKVVGSALGASGKTLSANNVPEIVMAGSFCCFGSTLDFSGSNISLSANGGPGNYGSGMYTAKLGNCNLIADAGPDVSISCGDTVTIAGTGGITYSWSPATGLSAPNAQITQAYPVTTTTYILTASDSTGCSDTESITVTVTGGPTVTVSGDVTICIGESTQLNANGALTYSWQPVTGLDDPSIANPIATPLDTITYTVTGTDIYGCQGNTMVTVIVNPLPSAPLISANLSLLTSTPAATYQWNLNGGPISGSVAQTHTVVTNGIYTVTIYDNNGCSATSAPYLFTNVGLNEETELIISHIPNPLYEDVEITLFNNYFSNSYLQVTDITGRIIKTIYFSSGKVTLPLTSLQQGVYFIAVMDDNRFVVKKKIVVVNK
jgi:hypothetical protein